MPNNQITFGINFTSDTTELKNIQQNLLAIKNMSAETGQKLISSGQFKGTLQDLEKIKTMAGQVSDAFNKTFNSALGTADSRKFNQALGEMGTNLAQVQTGFASLGNAGQFVFSQVRGGLAGINYQLKAAHPLINKIAEGFGKTFTWGVYSRVMNGLVGTIQSAYGFVQKLDASLNNIRIVTGKSSEEMAKFAVQANKAAKALGANTTDYTNASLIYYQQGLSDAEVRARTEVTVKVANITKQSADEVSEQLTAVWNGYRVSAEEAELYIDKLSAVAASTASDLEELSTAMSKVASAAAAMGVDIDQLTAQISTIVSVTRQDAANVGTALKTIYARMGDLAVAGDAVDEFGVSLGDVSGQLAIMGVNVLDQQGNMRDLGNVIEEVAAKWETWTEAQQQAAAVALAGKRQYNNLIALFNNWDMYQSALETSQTSEGTLQEQQDIYMESLEAHLEKLSTAGEKLYNSLFDSDSFKSLLDVLTEIVDKVGDFVDALGGGGNVLIYLGSILTSVFSAKISQGLINFSNNLKVGQANAAGYAAALQDLKNAQDAYDKGTGTAAAVEYHKDNLESAKRRTIIQTAARSGLVNSEDASKMLLQEMQLDQSKLSVAATAGRLEKMGGREEDQRTIKDALSAASKGTLTEGQLERVKNIDLSGYKEGQQSRLDSSLELLRKGTKKGKIGPTDKELAASAVDDDIGAADITEYAEAEAERQRENRGIRSGWKQAKADITAQAEELTNLGALSDETKNRISAALEDIQGKGQPTEDQMNELADAMKAGFEEAGLSAEEAAKALEDINLKQKQAEENAKKLRQQMKVQLVMQMVSAFSLLGNAIGSVTKIIKDDSLTGMEKFQQIAKVLIATLPALIPIIQSIEKSIDTLKVGVDNVGKAIGKAILSALPLIIAIAAIVAAVVTVLAIMDALDKKEHAAENRAKDAAKAYEQQKKALDDVKKAYDDLKNSIEDYQNAQAAIDNLVTGTNEWKQAIAEANQQVLDLLNTYPELARYITTDASGRMTISQEGFDKQLELQQKAMAEAQGRTASAQIIQNKANQEAAAERARNASQQVSDKDAARNWGLGLLLSPVQLGIIAAAGGLNNKQQLSDEDIDKISSQIVSGDLKTDADIAGALRGKGVDENLIAGLTAALKDNAAAIEKNNAVNATLGRQFAESKLVGVEEYENSEYKVIAQAIAQENADARVKEEQERISKDYSKKEVTAKYVEMMGGAEAGYTAKGNKLYKDGEEVDITQEQMIAQLAQDTAYSQEATEEAVKNAEAEAALVKGRLSKDFQNNTKLINNILQSAHNINTDISDVTTDQIKDIQKIIDDAGQDIIGEDGTNITQGLQTVIELYDKEKATILAGKPGFIRDLLFSDDAKLNSLTIEGKKKVAGVLESLYVFGGEEAAKYAGKFLEQYNADEIDKITAIFNQVDWSKRGASTDFAELMKAANIEIKNYNGSYNALINTLRDSRSIVKDFTTDWGTYKNDLLEISKILGNIHPGDVITEEDIEKLKRFNNEYEKYIVLTKNGYVFIGSPEDTKKTANETKQTLEDLIETFNTIDQQAEDFREDTGLGAEGSIAVGLSSPDTKYAEAIVSGKYDAIAKEAGIDINALKSTLTTKQGLDAFSPEEFQKYKDALDYNQQYDQAIATLRAFYGDEVSEEYLETLLQTYNETFKKGRIDVSGFESAGYTREGLIQALGLTEEEAANLTDEDLLTRRNELLDQQNQAINEVNGQINEILQKQQNDEYKLQSRREQIQYAISELSNFNELDELKKQLRQEGLFGEFESELRDVEQAFILEEVKNLGVSTDAWLLWADTVSTALGGTTSSLEAQRKMLEELREKTALDVAKASQDAERGLDILNKRLESAQKTAELARTPTEFLNSLREQKALEQDIIEVQKQKIANLADEAAAAKAWFEDQKEIEGAKLNTYGYNNLYDAEGNLNYGVANKIYKAASEAKDQDTLDAIEAIIDAQKELDEYQNAYYDGLNDLYDTTQQFYLDTMSDIADGFGKQLDAYQQIQDIINHDLNLIQLMYGEQAYEKMQGYYDKRSEYLQQQFEASDREFKYFKYLLDSIDASDGEAWEQANQQYQQALSNRSQFLEEWISAVKEKYLNAVKSVVSETFNAITAGAGGSDIFALRWEIQNDRANEYLDIVNRTYELRKLEAKYQESIQSFSGNVKAQQKLNDLLKEQQALLEKKDKLTQYDLDRANALYDIEVKRLQLEEARNNATKMQLVRDAEGNYRYQFIADQDNISQKQQELLEAQNNLWNTNKERLRSLGDEYLQVQSEYEQKIEETMGLSAEAREKAVQEINEQYFGENGKLKYLQDAMKTLVDNVNADNQSLAEAFNTTPEELTASLPGWEQFYDAYSQLTDDKLQNTKKKIDELIFGAEVEGEGGEKQHQNGLQDDLMSLQNTVNSSFEVDEEITQDFENAIDRAQSQITVLQDALTGQNGLQSTFESLRAYIMEDNGLVEAFEALTKAEEEAAEAAKKAQVYDITPPGNDPTKTKKPEDDLKRYNDRLVGAITGVTPPTTGLDGLRDIVAKGGGTIGSINNNTSSPVIINGNVTMNTQQDLPPLYTGNMKNAALQSAGISVPTVAGGLSLNTNAWKNRR